MKLLKIPKSKYIYPSHEQVGIQSQFLVEFNWIEFRVFFRLDQLPYQG